MEVFVSAVGFGLVTAALLAISAVGFTLQFSVTNVLNLAFGSVMTGSGFVAYGLNISGMNIWLAMAIAGLCGGVAQSTPYIGQPAYKRMGARAGFELVYLCRNSVKQADL